MRSIAADSVARTPGPVVVSLLALLLLACDGGETPDVKPPRELVLEQGCQVRQGCEAQGDGMVVKVVMGPELKPLKPFALTLQVTGSDPVRDITVHLFMKDMDMGLNRYRLQPLEAKRWTADITLPVCTSGRGDWLADIEIRGTKARYRMAVPFVTGN